MEATAPDLPVTAAPLGNAANAADSHTSIRRFSRLLWISLAALVVGEVLAAAGISAGPLSEIAYFLQSGNALLASAFLGAFVIHVLSRPPRGELLTAIISGGVAEVALAGGRVAAGQPAPMIAINVGAGLGLGSLVALGFSVYRGPRERRVERLSTLLAAAVTPAFLLVSRLFTDSTILLHPRTLDPILYRVDAAFGVEPSFAMGRLFLRLPPLRWLCTIVYLELPSACAFVYGMERRRGGAARYGDLLNAFLVAGLVGVVCYHLCPVVGPAPFFHGYPAIEPPLERVQLVERLAPPIFRNCVPSLHTTWALLLWWWSRPLPRAVRVFSGAWLALTLTATLGLGQHYLLDLVMAVPFAAALQAAFATGVAWSARAPLLVAGAVGTLAWTLALRFAPGALLASRPLFWVACTASVAPFLWLEHRLSSRLSLREPRAQRTPSTTGHRSDAVSSIAPPPVDRRVVAAIGACFFGSGFAALAYEVIFTKSLALAFGSTASATTAVLATYMGGIAIGSWLGGRVGWRTANPLRAYALCEAGVAAWCAASPLVLGAVRNAYVAIAAGGSPDDARWTALQVACGAIALLPPTVLMGMTLPILTAPFERASEGLGRSVSVLYALNTLGAAAGAVCCGYVILPFFGVLRATAAAVVLNLLVTLVALRLSGPAASASGAPPDRVAPSPASPPASADAQRASRRLAAAATTVLTVGGAVTIALEVTYNHLLAVVVGNSAFAFALMLFAFLLGLSAGAAAGRRVLEARVPLATAIAWSQAALASLVLAGAFVWNHIPAYFAGFEGFSWTASFGRREYVRFVVCCVTTLPVAACIGATYPLAVEAVTRDAGDRKVSRLGYAAALNTIGNIAGALLGSFVLLARYGSLRTLQILALTSAALAVLVALTTKTGQRAIAVAPALAAGVLLALQPQSLDFTLLADGANVYFESQHWGRAIDHAESIDGGLSVVAEGVLPSGAAVKTLLTNGKFQGDDNLEGQMPAQLSFSVFPLLHTPARGRALVIGLGTGVSLMTTRAAGFERIDVAELSADIVRLAREHFRSVNDGALDQPNVRLFTTDGRNFLTLERETYDVIEMEITSIWFAGAGSLYSRDFYELAAARLAPQGVLQQWIQLHRIDSADVASILATVRAVFPKVWLYYSGGQGIIVACRHDCSPTPEAMRRIAETPELAQKLSLLGPSPADLLSRTLLAPDGVDRFLQDAAAHGLSPDDLVSTDDNLFLEYHTPRGNVRPFEASLRENVAMLSRYALSSPAEGTRIKGATATP